MIREGECYTGDPDTELNGIKAKAERMKEAPEIICRRIDDLESVSA